MAKKLQQFEFATIKRSEIELANYNPRVIDEDNQKKLVKAIRKNGLVEPLVWNKRTHVLVGGHQRLAAADKIYKKDYDVPVSVIDVDEKQEKILNVQLNNPSMQGSWDLDSLQSLAIDDGIDFGDMGFNASDIDFMFDGEVAFDGSEKEVSDEEFEKQEKTEEEVEAEKDGLAELKQMKREAREQMKDQDTIDFYCKLIFPSNEVKQEVYRMADIPAQEEFITFDQLKRYFDKVQSEERSEE